MPGAIGNSSASRFHPGTASGREKARRRTRESLEGIVKKNRPAELTPGYQPNAPAQREALRQEYGSEKPGRRDYPPALLLFVGRPGGNSFQQCETNGGTGEKA
ncbi:hypothetical protein SKAU_G00078900 [Synaphobranchus kaupii]|uniref:Uncharacterized protein n=1 Tax=Synaphobranchus kaupii TaxID=118154 RepID=A0A9Q1J494_SYNKA|nr:hypothetical protein SKAU_G00078900 [Synaphobranchus kaupii]